jgi:anti-sigma factor RsiW
MPCRDVRELADSFLARELPAETRDEMRRHLETCPACRADLAAQRALRESLRRGFRHAGDLGPTRDFTIRLRTTLEKAARQGPAEDPPL